VDVAVLGFGRVGGFTSESVVNPAKLLASAPVASADGGETPRSRRAQSWAPWTGAGLRFHVDAQPVELRQLRRRQGAGQVDRPAVGARVWNRLEGDSSSRRCCEQAGQAQEKQGDDAGSEKRAHESLSKRPQF
jgi:hypothetical protein